MDHNCGEWVKSMGVVMVSSRWMWLKYIGVVSGSCCKEVYRFPHNISYPYSTCINLAHFLQQRPHFFFHFKMFFLSCLFKIRDPADMAI